MAVDFESMFAENLPEGTRIEPARRGKYDFAVAYPDPKSLPFDHMIECATEALREHGSDLAVYPHPQGNVYLREYVSEKIARDRQISVSADEIILGNGSNQLIEMICIVLVNPGDVVVTDSFVYGGTLNTLRMQFADIRGVESDELGMDPDGLESLLVEAISQSKKPKFVYLIPTFQNHQGWTMPGSRRQEILSITRKYGVPILEDDCYADNRYSGPPVTSFHHLDDGETVMYVGSFSKIIAPGMSLGYMTGPGRVIDKIMGIKQYRVSEFAAIVVEKYARKYLDAHIEEINAIQRKKRDSMLSSLGENFGSSAQWSNPDGGLYIWLNVDDGVDLLNLRDKALDQIDVGFHSGTTYSPDGSGKNYIRLCYGYNQPSQIEEGISRLADFFSSEGVLD